MASSAVDRKNDHRSKDGDGEGKSLSRGTDDEKLSKSANLFPTRSRHPLEKRSFPSEGFDDADTGYFKQEV